MLRSLPCFITLFLLLCLQVGLFAQIITVRDFENKAPISNVHVYNDSRSQLKVSDQQGRVDISDFAAYEDILFQHVSYEFTFSNKEKLRAAGDQVYLDFNALPEVILSANRNQGVAQRQVPEQVSTLTQKNVWRQNPQTSADLVAKAPGVFLQKSQMGGGSINLRGMEANRVLLVVDGVRMNNAIYRTGHLQNAITVDPLALERAEIVHGPSSLLYGSDALGGVVHFYTKSPKPDQDFEINTQFKKSTANNETSLHTDFSFALGPFATLISVSFLDFDDLKMGRDRSHGFSRWGVVDRYSSNTRHKYEKYSQKNNQPDIQKNTAYSQIDVLQKLLWTVSSNQYLLLNFQYSQSSDIPRFDKLTEHKGDSLKFATWFYGPQKRLMTTLKWDYQTTHALQKIADQITLNTAYQRILESRINRKFESLTRNTQEETVQVTSLNIDVTKALQGGQSSMLSYGFEAVYNRVKSEAFRDELRVLPEGKIHVAQRTDALTRYPDRGSDYTTLGLYALYMQRVTSANRFNLGLRFTHNFLSSIWSEDRFGGLLIEGKESAYVSNSTLSFSLSYLLTPLRDWKFSFLLSTGFRFPNVDDIGKIREKNGKLLVPNVDIKPEKSYNFELGLSHHNKDLGLGVSTYLYSNTVLDYISREAFTLPGGQDQWNYQGEKLDLVANQNIDFAQLFGSSSQFILGLGRYLKLSGQATYTYGVKGNGDLLPSIPPFFSKLTFDVEAGRAQASLFVD